MNNREIIENVLKREVSGQNGRVGISEITSLVWIK